MNVKNKKIRIEFNQKDGNSIFVDAIKTYEPDSSKREDTLELDDIGFAKASMYKAMPNFNIVIKK